MSLEYPKQASGHDGAPWYQNDPDEDASNTEYDIRQFELVSIPNDFNTKTMVQFIESGAFGIPQFQRRYVWDLKRASRLMESIILGLPIPQIFLYEKDQNDFLVIDGQQRLLSLYFFVKGRFPRKKMQGWHASNGYSGNKIRDMPLLDDDYFMDFKLDLRDAGSEERNQLHRHSYDELNDQTRNKFDMRTIRNVIIRQMNPKGYESMYEIFNRLNSGGVTLAPQEIRNCMYESKFYSMLYKANTREEWRRLIGRDEPDARMKDVEILLRGFAMLIKGGSYRPSMLKFLNSFSNEAKSYDATKVDGLERLFDSFLDKNREFPEDILRISGRFSPMLFEAAFVASCTDRIDQSDARTINVDQMHTLKENAVFKEATRLKTTDKSSVDTRLKLARSILMNGHDRA